MKHFLLLVVLLIALVASQSTAYGLPLPLGWEEMEVESKWEINPQQYESLVSAHPNGETRYGYTMEVRWDGIARKFVDRYYDSQSSELSQAIHSLRHRIRSTSRPLAPSNKLEDLESASWREDWQRVQYKGTACRLEATWFRPEKGDCRIQDRREEKLCTGAPTDVETVLSGGLPSHNGILSLQSDHPSLPLASLQPVLDVVDYRYRVRFVSDDIDYFEMSLDRLTSKELIEGESTDSLEAELEMLVPNPTEKDIKELLELSNRIQKEFALVPSSKSKAGVSVSECQEMR